MIVITLTDCPTALRGELTKWLFEINQGVYVGNVSSRVREQIWMRVQYYAENGRATMVYSSGQREQKFDFVTHQSDWEPIDFDGLKLIMKPSKKRISNNKTQLTDGFSNAAKMRIARQMMKKRKRLNTVWKDYIVIDIETTGLSDEHDEIIEIGAVRVVDSEIVDTFQSLILINSIIPTHVVKLTGITDELLLTKGKNLKDVLSELLKFVADYPIVVHNSQFEFSFLQTACKNQGLSFVVKQYQDTLSLAKRVVEKIPNYKLETLVNFFEISSKKFHRSLDDCFATVQLYQKLNDIRRVGKE